MAEQRAPRIRIDVQAGDFDPGGETEQLRGPATGAIVSFVGIARDLSDGFGVERMFLEHYPGMTERSLEDIARRAAARWDLQAVRIIHRHGELLPADRIVFVAVASVHRGAAFDACRYMVDFLKTEAPFWKRESGAGGERWVAAKADDDAARERWGPLPEA